SYPPDCTPSPPRRSSELQGAVGKAGFGGGRRQRDQQGGGKQGKAHAARLRRMGTHEPSKPRQAAPVRMVTGAAGMSSALLQRIADLAQQEHFLARLRRRGRG